MPSALNVIRDEHRSLGAVLHGLLHLVRELREGRAEPDFPLLLGMLGYIEAYPEKLHIPKEDRFLYGAMKAHPAAAALVTELEAEHQRGRGLAEELGASLRCYADAGRPGLARFAEAAEAYAAFHWSHMQKEEEVLMPLARRLLTPEQWAPIDAAFAANADPLADGDRREMRELFRRIVHLVPAPIGLGPARR